MSGFWCTSTLKTFFKCAFNCVTRYFFDQLIWYKFADYQSFEIREPQIKLRSYLLIILVLPMKIWVKELKSRILLRKIAEFFIIALAAKTTQTAEFRTTKSLLMQNWVFRPGVQRQFSLRTFNQTCKLTFSKSFTKNKLCIPINTFD